VKTAKTQRPINTTTLTRRRVLRGAGVALTLPWLESLAPQRARAQTAPAPRRFVPIYFPLGIRYPGEVDFWTPKPPAGGTWTLSPILEPLAPVKSRVTVLGQVDQTAFGTPNPEPGNGRLTGAFLTCAKVPAGTATNPTNGVSIDQRIAAALNVPSFQLGLSTLNSYCDGVPCAYSRSISWSTQGPLYKIVSPQSAFDAIVRGLPTTMPPPLNPSSGRKSILDFVLGNATTIQRQVGTTDRARMDQFLTSVRDLEVRIGAAPKPPSTCTPPPRPTLTATPDNVPPDYDRNAHADLMIDLIVMALTCDAARVVSFMLDDARSDFKYDFLQRRHFTDAGSTPQADNVTVSPLSASANNVESATVPDLHGPDQRATINWWYVSKVASLCQKLAAFDDGPNASVLDNSVVWFGSAQQGESFATDLPLLYVGSGGGVLRTDRVLSFTPSQSLSNIYLTLLRKVFGVNDASFGDSTGVVADLLE
jgi:hypothetical protein